MYQTSVLDNGLKIITAHMPGMESLSLGFWVKAGGRYETKAISGISHFLEHLLFEDTKNRTSQQIKEAIEGVGGSLNGFTGEEATCYLVKILKKHLDLSADVLSDMILSPALTDKAIEKERLVITEEINMYMDLPSHFVLDILGELMWPGHPLGMFLTGTIKTVNSITRQDILDYKNRSYTPNNMVIAAAGGLSHKRVVDSCSRYFSGLARRPAVSFKGVKDEQKGPRVDLRHKATEQTHMALGIHGVSAASPDRFAMSLLHIMLGANMSSRLFQEVREKMGLAYEINSGIKKYKDTGLFMVSAGIKNTKLCQATEIILKELKKIKDEPVNGAELQRAKEFYAGQTLMALEDTMDHMLWIGEQVVQLDKIFTSQEALKRINKLTPDDVQDAANKFFKSDKLNIAVIGPVGDKDKADINKIAEILG